MDTNNTFYVYVYLDPRKSGDYQYGQYKFEYEPFYVGKGSGERISYHLQEANVLFRGGNQHKLNTIRKIQ